MIRLAWLAFFLAALVSSATARDLSWAKHVVSAGLNNLYQVDRNLLRSEQPSKEAFLQLQKGLSLSAVLDLRENPHDDAAIFAPMKLAALHVPMTAGAPEKAKLIEALRFIKKAQETGPVLVHCWRGSDRTGLTIAMYRIVIQGWDKQRAIDEMENGGYHFFFLLKSPLEKFIRTAIVEEYRAALARP